jgi:hypothetical protein
MAHLPCLTLYLHGVLAGIMMSVFWHPMYTSSQASAVRGRELQVACNYVAPEKSGIGKRRLEKTLSGLRKTA